MTVNGDTTVEANETLPVNLSTPNGATIADGTAIGTITNDDTAPLPTLSIADASVVEGNPGRGWRRRARLAQHLGQPDRRFGRATRSRSPA